MIVFSTLLTCKSSRSAGQLLGLEVFSQYELEFRFPISQHSLLLKVQVHPLASQCTAKSTSKLPATDRMLLLSQISVRVLILLLRAAL